mmetsp:Transcript_8098/g.11776  ORF Transcript_8098/g.11776 Transcript_8098/m.11776 type:complete len:111 (-) Transcript_8098:204-536(-)
MYSSSSLSSLFLKTGKEQPGTEADGICLVMRARDRGGLLAKSSSPPSCATSLNDIFSSVTFEIRLSSVPMIMHKTIPYLDTVYITFSQMMIVLQFLKLLQVKTFLHYVSS